MKLRSTLALILRDLHTTHGRAMGGYLWAVLEPIAGIVLLTVIFSLAFRAPPIGHNFPIFYATGILPFLLYSSTAQKLMQAIWISKPLLHYPTVSYIEAILSRFVVNLMTQVLVIYIVVAAIMVLTETRVLIDIPMVLLGLLMAASLGLGIGVLNCLLISIAPDWQRVWAIATRPLFVLSTIFYLFESVPEPYQSLLWFNPLVHVVGVVRSGFFPTYDANYVSLVYVFGLALLSLCIGLFFLRRVHHTIINY